MAVTTGALSECVHQPSAWSALLHHVTCCAIAAAPGAVPADCQAGTVSVLSLALKHPGHVASHLGAYAACVAKNAAAISDAGKEARRVVVARLHACVRVLLALWPTLASAVTVRRLALADSPVGLF